MFIYVLHIHSRVVNVHAGMQINTFPPCLLCKMCAFLTVRLSCDFLHSFHCRHQSRVLLIPFNPPNVGQVDDEHQQAYEQLTAAFKDNVFSALIGWVIRQYAEIDDIEVNKIQDRIRPAFGDNHRAANGWKLALYFTIKVCFL